MIWLYRSRIPVGRKFPRSNDFYLPSLRVEGGGGRHPVRSPISLHSCNGFASFLYSLLVFFLCVLQVETCLYKLAACRVNYEPIPTTEKSVVFYTDFCSMAWKHLIGNPCSYCRVVWYPEKVQCRIIFCRV
jgi:hypothetical protein